MESLMDTRINVPKQIIPVFCIIIIIKSPTLLLVGLVIAYIIIQQSEPKITNINTSNTVHRAQTSRHNKNDPLLNPLPFQQQTKQDDSLPGLVMDDEEISNSSLDFERFPSCPTTLPRLDTHFNFVEDTNHIDKIKSSTIDWTAIHQELEYDQQREEIMYDYKGLPRINSTLMKKSLAFGSQHKLKQIPEYTQQLSPQGITIQHYQTQQIPQQEITIQDYQAQQIHQQGITTQEYRAQQLPQQGISNRNYQTEFIQDDIYDIGFTIQPTKSTSAQLGSRFKKAVKKITQTSNKTAGPNQLYKSPQINRSHDDLASFLPHPSASTRIHDRFKVKLNKLLKK